MNMDEEHLTQTYVKKIRKWSAVSDHVCVVGVFGKGPGGVHGKGLVLNHLLDRQAFQIQTLSDHVEPADRTSRSCYIEPYYNAAANTLYLQLCSVYDASHLAQLCLHLPQPTSSADSHAYWKSHEGQHARMLLYLFTVCHIMVVSQPRASFDTSYVKLFRALQNTREKLVPMLGASLKGLSVSRQWHTSGRMCTPRLLFICQQSDLDVSKNGDNGTENKSKKKSPRKVLELRLEDQIYRILRKTHILTNNTSHCLFSIPTCMNQAFVHIPGPADTLTDTVDVLIHACNQGSNHEKHKPYVMPIMMDGLPSLGEKREDSVRSFIQQHVDHILAKKGFDDNVRGAAISHFEFPTLKTWTEVAVASYELFMNHKDDPKLTAAFSFLHTSLDQDLRFSEMRCKKVLPTAIRYYQENASSHYTSTVHRNKLLQAMRTYSQHARGPASETFARQLQDECERFWQSGRQLCEVVSLTGHHCIHKLHLLPDDPELDPDSNIILSRLPHTNNNQTPCACNCGRTFGTREDPFEVKIANLDFFEELEEKCCRKLHHVTFPIYVPPLPRRPSQLISEGDSTPSREGITARQVEVLESVVEKMKLSSDPLESQSGCMTPVLELGQYIINPESQSNEQLTENTADSAGLTSQEITAPDDEPDQQGSSEPSTVPYTRALQGMLCVSTPRGLLPRFSSWALVCLGPSSLYNPTKGLDQPNFLRDSKHLLPWTMPVPKGSVLDSVWPSPSEMVSRSKKGTRTRDKKDGTLEGLRAYIGNEYECPRSHRFICSGPDKVVKVAAGSGGPKESGSKLVTHDVPLYYPCPCRSNKPPLGQLIRSFVLTPPGPVYIKLNPRVRPGPHPTPVFTPLPGEEGITLSASSLWVLRYPFVYASEAGPVMPPSDNQPTPGAKLLKGLYLVTLTPPQT